MAARLVERKIPRIMRILFTGNSVKPKSIAEQVVLEQLRLVIKSLNELTCPYCGRRFSSKSALAMHFQKGSSCGAALRKEIRSALRKAVAASSLCRQHHNKTTHCTICYKHFNGKKQCIEHVLREHATVIK